MPWELTEQAAFLRRICEDPLDDTVRLVYADWLEEHGQGERAKFIRVQIALSKCPPKHKTLTHGKDLGLSVTDRGDGYYTVTAMEGYECNVGDRVDVLCHTSYRKKPVWMYGLRVCRFINQESEFNGEVVLKKDEHSKPWEGTELEKREKELEPLLSSRLSAPCPTCKDGYPGWGKDASGRSLQADTNCLTCGGTGDLFRVNSVNGGTVTGHRPHRWLRGCLYLDVPLEEVCQRAMVEVPDMNAVNTGEPTFTTAPDPRVNPDWHPTPWAAALPPDVVGLWCVDREPMNLGVPTASKGNSFVWHFLEAQGQHCLPLFLDPLLQYADMFGGLRYYPTPDSANLALAHALRRWIYDCASRDSTTT